MRFPAFVLEHLHSHARVLEVGCGGGELALELAGAGHDVTAIDPRAPEGPIFRRVGIEGFDDPGPFDAVVASLSLHHVHDLEGALDRIASLLRGDGRLLVREFAFERALEQETARWHHGELLARGRADPQLPFARWLERRRAHMSDLHPSDRLRAELASRFAERFFAWGPYLYEWDLDDAAEAVERRLIDAGRIAATGWVYAGVPRPVATASRP